MKKKEENERGSKLHTNSIRRAKFEYGDNSCPIDMISAPKSPVMEKTERLTPSYRIWAASEASIYVTKKIKKKKKKRVGSNKHQKFQLIPCHPGFPAPVPLGL
jgi:hypothetical protein